MPCVLQEILPLFKGADIDKYFLVMDLIVPFYHTQALEVEGYGMALTILL